MHIDIMFNNLRDVIPQLKNIHDLSYDQYYSNHIISIILKSTHNLSIDH
jgi:hypothetical protein